MATPINQGYSKNSYGRILEQAFLKHAATTGVDVDKLVRQAKNDPYLFAKLVGDFDWDEVSQDFYDEYRRGLGTVYKSKFTEEAVRLGLLAVRKNDNKYERLFLEEQGSRLVVAVTDSTKKTLALKAQNGIQEGLSPYKTAERMKTAIDILPAHQKAVDNLRIKLQMQGLSQKEIQGQVALYHQRLLTHRARNIARTETSNARNQAQMDVWKDAIDQGELEPTVKKYWITAPDERRCPICAFLHGQKVFVHQRFTGPSGEKYQRPAAHPSCRCAMGLKDV